MRSVRVGEKPTVLLIGPTPPPYHGVAVATQVMLDSTLAEEFSLVHLDISDRRGIQHVNQPDFHDVVLFLRQWVRLLGLLIRRRPHLVHIPISQSSVGFVRDSVFIWPVHLAGGRVVLHLHGGNFRAWYEARGAGMKAYVRAVVKRAARIVVLGESLAGLFDGLVSSQRVAVVPNGLEWPATASRECRVARKRRYRVLYVGTLNRQKGALVLLAAVPLVEVVRQDIEFTFAGPWSNARDQVEAEALVAKHGLAEAVSFIGLVAGEEKRAAFESADLFIFPGLQQEGQPLVVIEAMAAGLPVLFTDRGCIRETVADAGIEVARDDPKGLADRIVWVFDHPDQMKQMGMTARHRYERFYTKSCFIERMRRIFGVVVKGAA
jgi:glycosyltransferase involved in cell wall biosynthesis